MQYSSIKYAIICKMVIFDWEHNKCKKENNKNKINK